MEALRPVAVGITPAQLESLHGLQTTMGDLHDLEVLSSTTIARYVLGRCSQRRGPPRPPPCSKTLEERHSAMLTSFLEAVDPSLDSWDRILASRRRWTKKPA